MDFFYSKWRGGGEQRRWTQGDMPLLHPSFQVQRGGGMHRRGGGAAALQPGQMRGMRGCTEASAQLGGGGALSLCPPACAKGRACRWGLAQS